MRFVVSKSLRSEVGIYLNLFIFVAEYTRLYFVLVVSNCQCDQCIYIARVQGSNH